MRVISSRRSGLPLAIRCAETYGYYDSGGRRRQPSRTILRRVAFDRAPERLNGRLRIFLDDGMFARHPAHLGHANSLSTRTADPLQSAKLRSAPCSEFRIFALYQSRERPTGCFYPPFRHPRRGAFNTRHRSSAVSMIGRRRQGLRSTFFSCSAYGAIVSRHVRAIVERAIALATNIF